MFSRVEIAVVHLSKEGVILDYISLGEEEGFKFIPLLIFKKFFSVFLSLSTETSNYFLKTVKWI